MNIILTGAPGSGKGTMSNVLVKELNVVHISTGDMLREAVSEQTSIGKIAKDYMDKGLLVPFEIIHQIIEERLSHDDIKTNGFVFDGYPRDLNQALDLDEILKNLNIKIDKVIDFNIDEQVLVDRITGRRTCKDCKAIYHVKTNPSKVEGVCDKCGGELVLRSDDSEDKLKERLSQYHQNTVPVLEYYAKQNLLTQINCNNKVVEVIFAEIKDILKGI